MSGEYKYFLIIERAHKLMPLYRGKIEERIHYSILDSTSTYSHIPGYGWKRGLTRASVHKKLMKLWNEEHKIELPLERFESELKKPEEAK